MLQALPPPVALITAIDRNYSMMSSANVANYFSTTTTTTATTATTVANKCKSSCKRFCPNVFTPNKCQDCFRQKNAHSQEALAENRACRKICKCGHLFVAPADVDFTNPTHRTRRWQRRWFILYDDGDLTFSVDEQADTIPQDVVDMHTVNEVLDAQKSTGQDFSILLKTPNQEYYVRGTSKEEIRWWYDVLVMYPRSVRYTKQQRNQNQKLRARTLPTNGLSDQQLLALKLSSSQAPDILTCSTTTTAPSSGATMSDGLTQPTATTADHHQIVLGTHDVITTSNQPSSGKDMMTSTASNRVKETANKSAHASVPTMTGMLGNARAVDRPHIQHRYPSTTILPSSNCVADETSLEMRDAKLPRKEKILPNSLVRSSTMDYLDQLKEKRMSNISAAAVQAIPLIKRIDVQPNDKCFQPDKVEGDVRLKPGPIEAFGLSTDSCTDTDLSSDADEGSVDQPQSVAGPGLTPSPATDLQKNQRFVFTGLSPKDIQDLKQLQRIMSKKSSTGSTSSRSSSSSSAYGLYPTATSLQSTALPVKAQELTYSTAPLASTKSATEVDFHTRPRSPPLNRTAISRVKERARVRSRSKSPIRERAATVPPRSSDQRTLIIDGEIKYEESVDESKPGNIATGNKSSDIEDRLQNLRREYLTDIQRSSIHQRHSDPSLPINFQMKALAVNRPKSKSLADQSTQISLDIRHYETLVSNLEKRLLDREQLLRETNQKLGTIKADSLSNVCERDRHTSVLEKRLAQSQRDLADVTKRLEQSEELNDDYQQRLKDFADLWAKNKDDKSKRKISQDGPGENRLVELQQQLVELEQSYDDMAAKKDAVISSTRKELDTVSKKLMETEQLLLLTIDKENDIIFKITGNESSAPASTDIAELGRKFLHALTQVKQLRQEKSSAEAQLDQASASLSAIQKSLASRDADHTSLQERFEGATSEITNLKTKCLRYEDELVAVKSQLAKTIGDMKQLTNERAKTVEQMKMKEETSHENCHSTIDALHAEISSLQSRLQNQEKRHASVISTHQERTCHAARRLNDSLTSLQDFSESSPLSEEGSPADFREAYEKSLKTLQLCHAEILKEMKMKHQQEMDGLTLRKDQELAEEAKATRAALEIIQKANQENVRAEISKVVADYNRMRDGAQKKLYETVRDEIHDLTSQLAALQSSSATEKEASLRHKEKFLHSYHDQLIELSRQYSDTVQNPVEQHTSGVFVRPRKNTTTNSLSERKEERRTSNKEEESSLSISETSDQQSD